MRWRGERGNGEGEIAVLGPFATMDVDHHPLAIQIANLEVDRFADPQSERVAGPEEGLHAQSLAGIDELKDLCLRDHLGQRVDVVDFRLVEDLPLAGTGGAIEELDSRKSDALGTRGDFAFDNEVQQVAPHLLLGDFIGRFAVEFGELPDSADIAIDGPLRLTGKTQILEQLLIKIPFEER